MANDEVKSFEETEGDFFVAWREWLESIRDLDEVPRASLERSELLLNTAEEKSIAMRIAKKALDEWK